MGSTKEKEHSEVIAFAKYLDWWYGATWDSKCYKKLTTEELCKEWILNKNKPIKTKSK